MQKFDVQIALEGVREASEKWATASREFRQGREKVLARLIHEAIHNFMSIDEFAQHSGLTRKQVRDLMRRNGFDPKGGKRMLSGQAAKALSENAELLGIKPHEMDLMSPLAYLPMGADLRRELERRTVSQVTEIEGEEA